MSNGESQDSPLARARALKRAGGLSQAADVLERALHYEDGARSDLLLEIAEVAARLGNFGRAHTAIDEALRRNFVEKNEIRRLKIIEQQAIIAFVEGQYREAGSHARRLYTQLQRTGIQSSPLLATVHNILGGVAWHSGRSADAISHAEESARICNECGDEFGLANVERNLGVLYFAKGEWWKAIDAFNRSEELCTNIDNVAGRAAALLNLGRLETSTGQHGNARMHLERSIEFSDRCGEPAVKEHAQIALAQLDLLDGAAERASERLEILLKATGLAEDTVAAAKSLKAMIECERGGIAAALGLAAEARRIAHDASLIESESDSCRALGRAYLESQAPADAEKTLAEAIELAEQVNDQYRRALALIELGAVYEKTHRLAEARARFDEASTVFTSLGAHHDVIRAESAKDRLAH